MRAFQLAAGLLHPLPETAAAEGLNAKKPASSSPGLRGTVLEQNQKRLFYIPGTGFRYGEPEKMRAFQPVAGLRRPLPETAASEGPNAKKPLSSDRNLRATVPEQNQKRLFYMPGAGFRYREQEQPQRRSFIKGAGVRQLPEHNDAIPKRLERLLRHRTAGTAESNIMEPSNEGSGKNYYPPVRMEVPAKRHSAKEAVVQDDAAAGRPRQTPGNEPAFGPEEFMKRSDNHLYRFENREDLNRLADRVYSLIEKRIRIERERRGKPCW